MDLRDKGGNESDLHLEGGYCLFDLRRAIEEEVGWGGRGESWASPPEREVRVDVCFARGLARKIPT
jgi:hypothetical protein